MTFLHILLKEEALHWKRMGYMFKVMEGESGKFIAFPICVIIVSFFHYCFEFMHILFTIFMFAFYNKQFKENLIQINSRLCVK